MTTDENLYGFIGHLSAEQEVKLQQLWMIILKAAKTLPDEILEPSVVSANAPDAQDLPEQHHRRHSSRSMIENNTPGQTSTLSSVTIESPLMAALESMGMSASHINAAEQALLCMGPAKLRMGLLNTIRHDHPDALLLRFLRARKWNVTKALTMMADAIEWRMRCNVDGLMAEGELHALKQSQNISNASERKDGHDFLAQMRMGKSYVHGVDKAGRPICVVRVRLHRPGEQSEETLERYIIHVIESVRLMLVPPVETAVCFELRLAGTAEDRGGDLPDTLTGRGV